MPRLMIPGDSPISMQQQQQQCPTDSPLMTGTPADNHDPSLSSYSVKLSCSSPGGRAVHSLSMTAISGGGGASSSSWILETHLLPLIGTVDDECIDGRLADNNASVIRTKLPPKVCSALSRYPPIELLCVDVLSPSPTSNGSSDAPNENGGKTIRLPSLCVYTQKDVFLLNAFYDTTRHSTSEIEGVVLNVLEPFEDVLLGNSAINILRIRQAPQKFNGYATLCPAGAMAMLTQYASTGEYSLYLYNGGGRQSSSTMAMSSSDIISHYIHTEDLVDLNEQFTDFCFCQSRGLSLLSSITVALLKLSGEVLFATPIVFSGTVVSRNSVTETLEFIESALNDSVPNSAEFKQFRCAQRFFNDVFPNSKGRDNFVSSSTINKTTPNAFTWPIKMQGPILSPLQLDESTYGDDSDEFSSHNSARNIEPFGALGDLVGLAMGHLNEMVDFAVVSPSSFIPRFDYESEEDSFDLDNDLTPGQILNRVYLSGDNNSNNNPTVMDIKLITDPMMDNVIHYLTSNRIISIATNMNRVASNKIRNYEPTSLSERADLSILSPSSRRCDLQPTTTAWNCLDVTSFQMEQNPITGAVISNDIQLGHAMVVRFSNRSMIAINLTERRHLCEMESFSASEQSLAIEDGGVNSELLESEKMVLRSVNETQSLSDTLQPYLEKVIKGISLLAQVGGSATAQEDITPDIFAAVVSIQSKCQKEIFMPLMTMNEHITARREELQVINDEQVLRLKALREMIETIRGKQISIREKTEIMTENSKSLADRSASTLQSSKDILPSITQAEYDYFQELKRLKEKLKIWKNEIDRLSFNASSLKDTTRATTPGACFLSHDHCQNTSQLLTVSGILLDKHKKNFASAGEIVDSMAEFAM